MCAMDRPGSLPVQEKLTRFADWSPKRREFSAGVDFSASREPTASPAPAGDAGTIVFPRKIASGISRQFSGEGEPQIPSRKDEKTKTRKRHRDLKRLYFVFEISLFRVFAIGIS